MSEKTIKFDFTSALFGVNPDTGAYLKEVHDELAKQIRGHLMSQPSGNGIYDVGVYRYAMEVKFYDNIIAPEAIIEAVDEVISWAFDTLENAFPFSNDEAPRAVRVVQRQPKDTNQVVIAAYLPTNLYVCPASTEAGEVLKSRFAADLLKCDGARSHWVQIDRIQLTIDDRYISIAKAQEHMQKVLDDAANTDGPFMPFNKKAPIQVEWTVNRVTAW